MQVQDVMYFISAAMNPQTITMVVDVTVPSCPLYFELDFFNVDT